MTTLTQEVQEALQKNLPAMAAEEMKQFIESAQKQEKELAELKKANLVTASIIQELKKKEADFDSAAKIRTEGYTNLQAATAKESKLALDFATEQIKQRDFVITQFYNALAMLTKNPRAIELISEFTNTQIPVKDQAGYSIMMPGHETKKGTNEKTENKE